MKNHTTTKNFVIGFTLGIIVTATLGATLRHRNEVGRFQIAAGDSNSAYVVDTVTGQVWSRQTSGSRAAVEFLLPKAER